MKAKELMIGDWVMIGDSYAQWQQNDYGDISADYMVAVNPIPLTTEILEKNGGRWNSLNGEYVFHTKRFDFHLEWVDELKEACMILVGWNFIHVRYVHELQHTLRLCGLNELADNFKIQED